MRNDGDVPGTRNEGTCQEVTGVADEVGSNHIGDLLRKSGGRGRTCGRGDSKESFLDSGSTSVPDTHGEQFDHCGGKQRDTVVKQSTEWRIVEVPDSEDVGVFVGIVLLSQGVKVGRDCRGKQEGLRVVVEKNSDNFQSCHVVCMIRRAMAKISLKGPRYSFEREFY